MAVQDISVTFEEKKIYALLGRNGAGKSTLLNLITGRHFADEGKITIDGEQVLENDRQLRKIFMMSEKNLYPDGMKVKEAMSFTQSFYPQFDMEYAMQLTKRFELRTDKRIKSLSTGYQSIFKMITALSTNAPFILLDEPVLGLDANHRDLFYRVLIEKYAEGKSSIIISTHLIEEAAAVVEHVVIIKNGKIIRDEDRDTLLEKAYMVTGQASKVDAFTSGRTVIGSDQLGGMKTAYLIGACAKSEIPEGVEISRMDLQRLFIQLTNE
jgi:ABC-2 type transport system ATP-binding protein